MNVRAKMAEYDSDKDDTFEYWLEDFPTSELSMRSFTLKDLVEWEDYKNIFQFCCYHIRENMEDATNENNPSTIVLTGSHSADGVRRLNYTTFTPCLYSEIPFKFILQGFQDIATQRYNIQIIMQKYESLDAEKQAAFLMAQRSPQSLWKNLPEEIVINQIMGSYLAHVKTSHLITHNPDRMLQLADEMNSWNEKLINRVFKHLGYSSDKMLEFRLTAWPENIRYYQNLRDQILSSFHPFARIIQNPQALFPDIYPGSTVFTVIIPEPRGRTDMPPNVRFDLVFSPIDSITSIPGIVGFLKLQVYGIGRLNDSDSTFAPSQPSLLEYFFNKCLMLKTHSQDEFTDRVHILPPLA
jgi:hypothetical protein